MSNVKSLDDLLNSDVEELVDLKEFKPLPVGSYQMVYSDWEKSEDPAGVRLKFRVEEILELEHEEQAAEVDKEVPFSQLYMFYNKEGKDNSMGQGQLKLLINEVLKPKFGGDTIVETLDNAKGAVLAITVTQRRDKNDKEKIYNGIKTVVNVD